jgi:hypothetical protein
VRLASWFGTDAPRRKRHASWFGTDDPRCERSVERVERADSETARSEYLGVRRRCKGRVHPGAGYPAGLPRDSGRGMRWGGEWSASRPGRALAPEKGPPGTHCTGGWVGPRAGLDTG